VVAADGTEFSVPIRVTCQHGAKRSPQTIKAISNLITKLENPHVVTDPFKTSCDDNGRLGMLMDGLHPITTIEDTYRTELRFRCSGLALKCARNGVSFRKEDISMFSGQGTPAGLPDYGQLYNFWFDVFGMHSIRRIDGHNFFDRTVFPQNALATFLHKVVDQPYSAELFSTYNCEQSRQLLKEVLKWEDEHTGPVYYGKNLIHTFTPDPHQSAEHRAHAKERRSCDEHLNNGIQSKIVIAVAPSVKELTCLDRHAVLMVAGLRESKFDRRRLTSVFQYMMYNLIGLMSPVHAALQFTDDPHTMSPNLAYKGSWGQHSTALLLRNADCHLTLPDISGFSGCDEIVVIGQTLGPGEK